MTDEQLLPTDKTDIDAEAESERERDVESEPAFADAEPDLSARADADVPAEADAAAEVDTEAAFGEVTGAIADTAERSPQYGVGPFSIREVALAGVWLVAFIVSFFPLTPLVDYSLWGSGVRWILLIGIPTVAVFLIVLRRLSPDGIRRVGSLGIDQFASVAFSVAAMVWLQEAWDTIATADTSGSWVMWVELVMMLAGVVLTVFAPLIPLFAEDFRGRREVVAHPHARPIRPVSPRPAREPRPVATAISSAPVASTDDGYGVEAAYDTPEQASYGAAVDDVAEAEAGYSSDPQPSVNHQAFWALVPEERDVVDDRGAPLFRIGPTAWALVIEDRGETFVVRHEDGRVGFLHDVTGVTRG